MEYKEYGSKNNDIIILLHGGGLSWWNYIDEISLLENDFHIVIPILEGHSGSDTNFTSIDSNALEIINFINKNYNGKVKLIGGLSLGGKILLEIGYISKMVNSRNRINEKIIFLHVSNTEEICDLMHSFLD